MSKFTCNPKDQNITHARSQLRKIDNLVQVHDSGMARPGCLRMIGDSNTREAPPCLEGEHGACYRRLAWACMTNCRLGQNAIALREVHLACEIGERVQRTVVRDAVELRRAVHASERYWIRVELDAAAGLAFELGPHKLLLCHPIRLQATAGARAIITAACEQSVVQICHRDGMVELERIDFEVIAGHSSALWHRQQSKLINLLAPLAPASGSQIISQ